MSTKTATPATKTEQLVTLCARRNGATAAELVEQLDQTMQVVRSRIYSLTKAGRIEAVADTSPRRYRAVKPATAKKTTAKAKK